jgi:hypothetical protein
MSTQHPITPPPKLVGDWLTEAADLHLLIPANLDYLATRAAQWGADQELEACIDVLGGQWEWDMLSQCTGWKEFRYQSEEILRSARRPKPPTMKERALKSLDGLALPDDAFEAIRFALEALND